MAATTTSVAEQRTSVFPQLSYHYGLSFTELAHMPQWAVELYVKELPRLLAEQHQAAIEAATFPNLKKNDQRGVLRRLARMMNNGRREQAQKIDIVGAGAESPLAGMVGVEIVE